MKAFFGDSKVKEKYLNRVKAHIAADNLIRGEGWTGKKGCAVGCTLEEYNHAKYETELGIPTWLAKVEDKIFEEMSEEKSRNWPELFLSAIKPGVDLEKAKPKFLLVVLNSALTSFDHKKYPKTKDAIDDCIKLWKRKDIGTERFKTAAGKVRAAAAAAADAYADAYADAAAADADAAAYAADAAADAAAAAAAADAAAYADARRKKYDYFADELIKILKSIK